MQPGTLSRVLCTVCAVVLAVLAVPATAAAPVVLLRSDTTSAFFRAHGGDYERLLNPWRDLFARHGIQARELRAEELAAVKQPAVLVLASAVALSDAERRAIRARLAAGWSALGTWATGVRDGKGEWSGYGFIDELFAAQVAPDLAPGKDEAFLLPFGETPLTHALPAGKRIFLLKTSEPFLRVRARNAAARFGNYMREATQPGALLGAAAFDERGGARRAFFGFAEASWSSAQADVDALLLGTLDWLQRKPIVVKSAWPHPHQAALLLEMDTEDKFDNSVRFARQLERYRIRGTFYSVTSEARKFPAVVKRLASRHEIAYHAEVHNGFAKLARVEQDARLNTMIRQMASLVPDVTMATGFRAPLEQYDADTEKALRALGLRHHAASPASRDDALPGFSPAEPGLPPDEALVVLPRTWLDDINLLTTGLLKGMPAEQMLLSSLQDTLAMRSFGLLSLHTQNFYPGGVLERVTPRLLQAIAKHGGLVWTAPGESIARWWRDRAAVEVSVREEPAALRIRLQVARGPVTNLRLVLMPPGTQPPRLEGGQARLEKLDAQRWALVFAELRRGVKEVRVRF
jgi:peptidoglycan/xylan/chitin deacetylase (PgdA/CDA1 family)